ncbi:YesK family protein [Oceanobacillus massiliensis]|uniref:YesK family protein n=1 Tax=Oceanobacillus massiliensis TaxID=1465765 RepID=UPI000288ACFE|nr:YesK family protein [Oceanobacillus massiliensis]
MDGFNNLIIMTVIFTIIIGLIALIFREKKIIVPIITSILSIILVVISFIIGGWEGIGLGFISLSINIH